MVWTSHKRITTIPEHTHYQNTFRCNQLHWCVLKEFDFANEPMTMSGGLWAFNFVQLSTWLVHGTIGWVIARSFDRLINQTIVNASLMVRTIVWLIEWLIGWLIHRLLDCLIDWVIDWVIDTPTQWHARKHANTHSHIYKHMRTYKHSHATKGIYTYIHAHTRIRAYASIHMKTKNNNTNNTNNN